jgi:hypothetical protein
MIDIDILYQELERLHNLSETLLRSIEYRDIEEEANQPDLALIRYLTESLASIAHKVAGQQEIPTFLPSDLPEND